MDWRAQRDILRRAGWGEVQTGDGLERRYGFTDPTTNQVYSADDAWRIYTQRQAEGEGVGWSGVRASQAALEGTGAGAANRPPVDPDEEEEEAEATSGAGIDPRDAAVLTAASRVVQRFPDLPASLGTTGFGGLGFSTFQASLGVSPGPSRAASLTAAGPTGPGAAANAGAGAGPGAAPRAARPTGFEILLTDLTHPAFEDLLEFAIVAPILDGKGHDDLYRVIDTDLVLAHVWRAAGAFSGPATAERIRTLFADPAFRARVKSKLDSVTSDSGAKAMIAALGRNICTKLGVDFDFVKDPAATSYKDYHLFQPSSADDAPPIEEQLAPFVERVLGLFRLDGQVRPVLVHVDSVTGHTIFPFLKELHKKGIPLFLTDSPGVRADPASFDAARSTQTHADGLGGVEAGQGGQYASTTSALTTSFPACLPCFQRVTMYNTGLGTLDVVKKFWLFGGDVRSDEANSGCITTRFLGESVDIEICRALAEAIQTKGLLTSSKPVKVTGDSGLLYQFTYTVDSTKKTVVFNGYIDPKKPSGPFRAPGSLRIEWNRVDSVIDAAAAATGLHPVAVVPPLLKSDGDFGSIRCATPFLASGMVYERMQLVGKTERRRVGDLPGPYRLAHMCFDRISRDVGATTGQVFELFQFPNGILVVGQGGSRGGEELRVEDIKRNIAAVKKEIGEGELVGSQRTSPSAELRAIRQLLYILPRIAGEMDTMRAIRKARGFPELVNHFNAESTQRSPGTVRIDYILGELATLERGLPPPAAVNDYFPGGVERVQTILQYASDIFRRLDQRPGTGLPPPTEHGFLLAVAPLILELRAVYFRLQGTLADPRLREQTRYTLTPKGTALETEIAERVNASLAAVTPGSLKANTQDGQNIVTLLLTAFKEVARQDCMDRVRNALIYETMYTNPESLLNLSDTSVHSLVQDVYQNREMFVRSLLPADLFLEYKSFADLLSRLTDGELGVSSGSEDTLLSRLRKIFITTFGFDPRTATHVAEYVVSLVKVPGRRTLQSAQTEGIGVTKTVIVPEAEALLDEGLLTAKTLELVNARLIVEFRPAGDTGNEQAIRTFRDFVMRALVADIRDRQYERKEEAAAAASTTPGSPATDDVPSAALSILPLSIAALDRLWNTAPPPGTAPTGSPARSGAGAANAAPLTPGEVGVGAGTGGISTVQRLPAPSSEAMAFPPPSAPVPSLGGLGAGAGLSAPSPRSAAAASSSDEEGEGADPAVALAREAENAREAVRQIAVPGLLARDLAFEYRAPADGDCLYWTIAKFYRTLLNQEGDPSRAEMLERRAAIAEHFTRMYGEAMGEQTAGQRLTDLQTAVLAYEGVDAGRTPAQYAALIQEEAARGGQWGGQLELALAADLYEVTIRVHTLTGAGAAGPQLSPQIDRYGEGGGNGTWNIFMIAGVHGQSNHYDPLFPSDGGGGAGAGAAKRIRLGGRRRTYRKRRSTHRRNTYKRRHI